jgi:hypothetical protein
MHPDRAANIPKPSAQRDRRLVVRQTGADGDHPPDPRRRGSSQYRWQLLLDSRISQMAMRVDHDFPAVSA